MYNNLTKSVFHATHDLKLLSAAPRCRRRRRCRYWSHLRRWLQHRWNLMCRSYRVLLTLGAATTIHTTRTICTREAVCIDCASPTTAHAARAFSVVALREANLTFTRALAAVCALSTTGTIATCPQNKPLNQSINGTHISIHTVSLWVQQPTSAMMIGEAHDTRTR